MAVRVRFAPSPTGHLHLGGLRTALFNYLFAASEGGKCILRLEDTDRNRIVPGAFEDMTSLLRWAGIVFDEGPLEGGQYGPYVQSERKSLHQHYAKELVKLGAAYHCFCPKERLESLKQSGSTYDGYCRRLSTRESEEKLRLGIANVIRLKVPVSQRTIVDDVIYGKIEHKNVLIDDQVLLKSDGSPTYHLANVVDDHTMEISHVLRGKEWLSSTGKHLLLYQALSWQPPVYAHLPLLLNKSKEKLSKRNQDTFVKSYKDRGILPESIVNFTSLLGWHPKTTQTLFTLDELRSSFSLSNVTKSGGACVDEKFLLWVNKQYHSRLCSDEKRMKEFVEQLRDSVMEKKDKFNMSVDDACLSSDYLEKIVMLIGQEHPTLVPNIPDEVPYFWTSPDLTACTEHVKPDILATGGDVLPGLYQMLRSASFASSESLKADLKQFSSDQGHSAGRVMALCRWALTGAMTRPGPPIVDIMAILGQEEVLIRLQRAIDWSIK